MAKKVPTKAELFLELANPDEKGFSRWVCTSEFTGPYARLKLGNGLDFARSDSKFAQKYNIEKDYSRTKGNGIDAIRLNGLKEEDPYTQYIRPDIKKAIQKQRCVILGTSNPEVDHKNGMKNEGRVMKNEDQRLSDFQPLGKAANDAKRQCCKECRESGIRYDATQLGYPMPYYAGEATHNHEENACIGCFWYDPLEFKKHLAIKETPEV